MVSAEKSGNVSPRFNGIATVRLDGRCSREMTVYIFSVLTDYCR